MTIRAIRAPEASVLLGFAQADITPPPDMYHRMWGAAAHEQAEGIHRPLVAQVLWLAPLANQAGNSDQASMPGDAPDRESPPAQPPLVLVMLDHCLLLPSTTEAIASRVARQADVSPESVLVTFSHTHAAGLMNLDRSDRPGGQHIGPYLEQVVETIGRLADEARQSAAPSDLVAGQGACSLAAHRDYYDSESRQFVCGFNPAGEADDTLLAVRVTRSQNAKSRELLWLVNYACHPTTLAWQNRLISPDFPGALRELVEQSTDARCVFLQGASGDLGPRHGFVGDLQVADAHGRKLAYSVLALRESLPPAGVELRYAGPVTSGATIGTWQYQPLAESRSQPSSSAWRLRRWVCKLPYRSGLPSVDELQRQKEGWQQKIADSEHSDSTASRTEAAEARAQVERCDRQLSRLRILPQPEYPFEITVCQTGTMIWVFVQGEPYQQLQRELRQQFPDRAIIVMTLVNAWGASYLPPKHLYDTGIYQESIAVLAPGALERVTHEIAQQIEEWRGGDSSEADADGESGEAAVIRLDW